MAALWKRKWWIGAALVAVVAWMVVGRSQQPVAAAAVIEDKTYTVTPAAMKVKAGIVTGDVTEMKVVRLLTKLSLLLDWHVGRPLAKVGSLEMTR